MIEILYKGNENIIIANVKFLKNKKVNVSETQLKELRNYNYFKDREQKIFLVIKKEIASAKTKIVEEEIKKDVVDLVEQPQKETKNNKKRNGNKNKQDTSKSE